jgi:serine/threonine-protein kinase HipA
MKNCLICNEPLSHSEVHYHKKCSMDFFGSYPAPNMELDTQLLEEYAKALIGQKIAIPGVQRKISLNLTNDELNPRISRLTVVGMNGNFILKLPTETYPFLPEMEFASMSLAKVFEIPTVPFALIPMPSGELAYITKRIDRDHKSQKKIPMEDFCQITERLTEDKYKGSLESIGKRLKQLSIYSGLDLYNFYLANLYSWVIGNSDMHLKNFSLYLAEEGYRLTPFYDLLATQILIPEDSEETALTLNGKKAKIKFSDWQKFADVLGIPAKTQEKILARFHETIPNLLKFISKYPIPINHQKSWKQLIRKRMKVLSN